MQTASLASFFEMCTIAVLAYAAVSDIRTFRIPNILPVLVMTLFGGYFVVAPSHVSLINHLASLILVFTAGLIVFRYRIMAGGDVKLLAAIALWFSVGQLYIPLTLIALAGGLQALLIIAYHYLSSSLRSWSVIRTGANESSQGELMPGLRARRVPYGVAIATGSICALLLTHS